MLALMGGMIGLPLPDEVLLTYVGYQVYQENMGLLPSLIASFIGGAIGVSFSYFLGVKLGLPFLHKHGSKIHLPPERVERIRGHFTKYGSGLLVIGFFIPGVRHVTAYLAGINEYSFRRFAFYAYTGALIWISTFIILGRMLGKEWHRVHEYMAKSSVLLIGAIVIVGFLVNWYRKQRSLNKS